MADNDSECIHEIQYRWKKEQQLIRQKYQIPYNMAYRSKSCYSKPISITLQTESLFKHDKITVTNDNLKRKINRLDRHHYDSNIPPMYCSKCHSYLTECSCQDGLGQWWIHLQKKSQSTDKLSKKSLINSIHERHVSFDTSLIELSSIERTNSHTTKSISNKQQYVLLDWNNRQSLLKFIQTIEFNKNLSNMTIEQLHKLITNNNHIHIFNSIIDLILTMNKEQHHTSLCHIYIDPFYYSTIQGTIPLSQSQLIADNINLNRALHSIQKIAVLLGVKIDQSFSEILSKKISTKQRKSILNQQLLFIASKMPYNTFADTSIHTQ